MRLVESFLGSGLGLFLGSTNGSWRTWLNDERNQDMLMAYHPLFPFEIGNRKEDVVMSLLRKISARTNRTFEITNIDLCAIINCSWTDFWRISLLDRSNNKALKDLNKFTEKHYNQKFMFVYGLFDNESGKIISEAEDEFINGFLNDNLLFDYTIGEISLLNSFNELRPYKHVNGNKESRSFCCFSTIDLNGYLPYLTYVNTGSIRVNKVTGKRSYSRLLFGRLNSIKNHNGIAFFHASLEAGGLGLNLGDINNKLTIINRSINSYVNKLFDMYRIGRNRKQDLVSAILGVLLSLTSGYCSRVFVKEYLAFLDFSKNSYDLNKIDLFFEKRRSYKIQKTMKGHTLLIVDDSRKENLGNYFNVKRRSFQNIAGPIRELLIKHHSLNYDINSESYQAEDRAGVLYFLVKYIKELSLHIKAYTNSGYSNSILNNCRNQAKALVNLVKIYFGSDEELLTIDEILTIIYGNKDKNFSILEPYCLKYNNETGISKLI